MIKNAELKLSVYDFNSTTAEIKFKFGNKVWTIENWQHFSSPKAAENQAKKLANKLGIQITEAEIF